MLCFLITGSCSQYSGLDYNGMNMSSPPSQAASSSTEGNISQSGYSSWNGSSNSTVSYTQNVPPPSSGSELSSHPGYSKKLMALSINFLVI